MQKHSKEGPSPALANLVLHVPLDAPSRIILATLLLFTLLVCKVTCPVPVALLQLRLSTKCRVEPGNEATLTT